MTNVVLAGAKAWIAGAPVAAAGVAVSARNTATLTALAKSQIEGFDKTFGAVLAFNTIGWKPSNILFNAVDAILGDPLISSAFNGEQPSEALAWIRDAAITATGAVSVTAAQAATLESEVGNEGVAAAQLDGVLTKGSATDGISGGGAIASNKVDTRAQAWIDHTSATEVVRAASITVDAQDAASIESRSTVVQQAIVSNTAQGIAAYIDQILPLDYDYTTRSGSRTLRTGDQVRVGTGYDTTKGDVGSLYRYLGTGATLDLGTLSYKTDTVNWKKLGTGTTAEELYPGIGNLTKSDARAIGVLVVLNDVRASAEAWVDHTDLQAGTIAIGASEAAQLLAEVTSTVEASGGSFYGTGTVLAANGILATNVVLSKAAATADHSVLDGAVSVTAANRAAIDATVQAATATGDTGVSVVLAFNTLGWKSQNFIFNAVDALLGDPLIAGAFNGEQPAEATAIVRNSTVRGTSLAITADNAAQLNATISNAAESAASALWKATGKAIGGLLASNKVSSAATARLENSTASPLTGAVTIAAADDAGVFANVLIVSSSITSNDGGAAVLQQEINALTGADYRSSEGVRTIKLRQRVKAADGKVYEYMGVDGDVDLSDEAQYADLALWKPVLGATLIPQGQNVTTSDSMAIGGLVVFNDLRSAVAATITGSTVSAGSVAVSALERAAMVATADATASSSGGSAWNAKGESLAVNAVIAVNVVLSAADAVITSSPVTATAGALAVSAGNDSSLDARDAQRRELGREVGRRRAGVQHRRLPRDQPAVRHARRAPRARGHGVRHRAGRSRVRDRAGLDPHGHRRDHGRRPDDRDADRLGRQRRDLDGHGLLRGFDAQRLRRAGLQQGEHADPRHGGQPERQRRRAISRSRPPTPRRSTPRPTSARRPSGSTTSASGC